MLGLIPLFLVDAKLLTAMAIVIGGVFLMLRGRGDGSQRRPNSLSMSVSLSST
jgi:hypothetical protein